MVSGLVPPLGSREEVEPFVDMNLSIPLPSDEIPSISSSAFALQEVEIVGSAYVGNSDSIGDFADEVNLRSSHIPRLSNTSSFASLESQLPNLSSNSISSQNFNNSSSSSVAVSESIRMILAISTAALESEKQRQAMKQKRLELFRLGDAVDKTMTANQSYQSLIKLTLNHLFQLKQRAMDIHDIAAGVTPELSVETKLAITAPGTQQLTLPWFKHWHGKDLPPSTAGADRDLYLATIHLIPWTKAERDLLKKEIIAQNNRAIAALAVEADEDVNESLQSYPDDFFIESTEMLNWDKISLVIPRRDAVQCQIQWLENDHPLINKTKWSIQETESLYQIVDEANSTDWKAIAETLGTKRTAHDCLRVFRNRTDRRDWTPEEDTKLLAAYDNYGENWQDIARVVSRSASQCYNRYKHSLDPSFRKGKWSKEEDEALKRAMAVHGTAWSKVVVRVPGRNVQQVAERWQHVNPGLLDFKVWSTEQDDDLLRLRAEGKGWSEISRFFNIQRTDKHCSTRHAALIKHGHGGKKLVGRKPRAKAKSKASTPSAAKGKTKGKGKKRLIEETIEEEEEEEEEEEDEEEEEEEISDYSKGDFIGGIRIGPIKKLGPTVKAKAPRKIAIKKPVLKKRKVDLEFEEDVVMGTPSPAQENRVAVRMDLDGEGGERGVGGSGKRSRKLPARFLEE